MVHSTFDFSPLLKCDINIQWNLFITVTIRTTKTVLYMEVSLIQRLSNTVKYYCGMRTSVLKEVSFIQSVLYREVPLWIHSI